MTPCEEQFEKWAAARKNRGSRFDNAMKEQVQWNAWRAGWEAALTSQAPNTPTVVLKQSPPHVLTEASEAAAQPTERHICKPSCHNPCLLDD